MNVSILVTAFKRSHLFEKSLPQILDQLTPDDEIVYVNDGPEDGAEKMLEYSFVKDPKAPTPTAVHLNYQYINTGNTAYHNCVRAKNIGLKACRNELIIIRDPEVMEITQNINFAKEYFSNPENQRHYICVADMTFELAPQDKTLERTTSKLDSYAPFVAAVMKKELMAVNGWYERFIKYWGNDDNNLAGRLTKNGVRHLKMMELQAYHQYHDRPPKEAMGDCNNSLLEKANFDNDIVANQDNPHWGEL